jgi:hypothetical protein
MIHKLIDSANVKCLFKSINTFILLLYVRFHDIASRKTVHVGSSVILKALLKKIIVSLIAVRPLRVSVPSSESFQLIAEALRLTRQTQLAPLRTAEIRTPSIINKGPR